MVCPFCGTHIEDGLSVCPACHADLSSAVVSPRIEQRYCPSCGALVPEGRSFCPSCGMPVDEVVPDETASAEPSPDEVPADQTNEIPRIASAIPTGAGPFSATSANDRLPRRRVFILSFCAALLVVGGATLYITRPWDPDAYSTKATVEADTSSAGYPGSVSKLSGQDKGIAQSSTEDADARQLQELSDYYDQLGDLRDRLGQSEQDLRAQWDADASTRSAGYATAQQDSLDLSNLIQDISDEDTSTGTYADQVEELGQLGSWLRNWADALQESWQRAQAGTGRSQDYVLAPLDDSANADGTNSYAALFDQAYEGADPAAQ